MSFLPFLLFCLFTIEESHMACLPVFLLFVVATLTPCLPIIHACHHTTRIQLAVRFPFSLFFLPHNWELPFPTVHAPWHAHHCHAHQKSELGLPGSCLLTRLSSGANNNGCQVMPVWYSCLLFNAIFHCLLQQK